MNRCKFVFVHLRLANSGFVNEREQKQVGYSVRTSASEQDLPECFRVSSGAAMVGTVLCTRYGIVRTAVPAPETFTPPRLATRYVRVCGGYPARARRRNRHLSMEEYAHGYLPRENVREDDAGRARPGEGLRGQHGHDPLRARPHAPSGDWARCRPIPAKYLKTTDKLIAG